MRKIKICVLMGGRSPEYEVSLMTGRNVAENLDSRKYEVFPMMVDKKGSNLDLKMIKKFFAGSPARGVVFIAMHGPYGEDGTVQGLLELAGLPYTGSGVLASALGMNKIMFRKIMEQEKIPVPRYLILQKSGRSAKVLQYFPKQPIFVKPYNQGSSVGASIVRKRSHLGKALKLAFSYSNPVLVEEYLNGLEVSVGILGNENPQALPVAGIVPKNEFFDYEAKYTPGKSEEIVPARIPKSVARKVQETAVRVFKAVGARGFARVDMILQGRTPVVLEINTIPGLTPVSILPKEAAVARISYSRLLDRIINLALKKP